MNYEINVAARIGTSYHHLFATHERSLTTLGEAKKVYDKLVAAFPAPEYNVTVTRRERVGYAVDLSQPIEGQTS